MDTTFVLGLLLGFFVVPGVVIGFGLLIIRELKPGYLTKHKEKALAVICIILAVYGTSIICTESEGSLYTGQPIAERKTDGKPMLHTVAYYAKQQKQTDTINASIQHSREITRECEQERIADETRTIKLLLLDIADSLSQLNR